MWEKPSYEVINVGAEVTAYLYTDEEQVVVTEVVTKEDQEPTPTR